MERKIQVGEQKQKSQSGSEAGFGYTLPGADMFFRDVVDLCLTIDVSARIISSAYGINHNAVELMAEGIKVLLGK